MPGGEINSTTMEGFVQELDPGAVGANFFWLKLSDGSFRIRNASNTDWVSMSANPKALIYPPFAPVGLDDEFDDGIFNGWTLVDAGARTPTLVETNDCLSILVQPGDAAAELHAWMKTPGAIAANDWIEVAVRGLGPQVAFHRFGLVFSDGLTFGAGNQVVFIVSPSQQGLILNSATGFNAEGAITNVQYPYAAPHGDMIMRFKYLGANSWDCLVSVDGVQYASLFGPQARTLTPTSLGFWATSYGASTRFNWSLRYARFGNG